MLEKKNSISIIGSGLVANAFKRKVISSSKLCIFASGVSNSLCSDPEEFQRERVLLIDTLRLQGKADYFLYFSTCSINEPASQHSPYIQHKVAMESLVSQHPNFLIARLPQVAGNTSNPHTLLNFLYRKISRNEKFMVWKNATRNIIDIDDVVAIVYDLITKNQLTSATVNVANPHSCSIMALVTLFEKIIGKSAFIEMTDEGVPYKIDVSQINSSITELGLLFDDEYVMRVLQKYYQNLAVEI